MFGRKPEPQKAPEKVIKEGEVKVPPKPKEIVEPMPQGIIEEINKKIQEKGKLLHQFLHTSMRLVAMRQQQEEFMNKIDNIDKAVQNKIDYAYKKMKLNKRKNIRWRYDGKGNFVGREMPQKPQPPRTPVPPPPSKGEGVKGETAPQKEVKKDE